MKIAPLIFLSIVGFALFFAPIKAKENYTCDTCHEHANLYTSHLEGGKYCSQCHGEIHEIHSFACETCHVKKPMVILCHSAPSDAQILTPPPEKNAVCENCHMNLVEIHGSDCQSCHIENINEIHLKANWR